MKNVLKPLTLLLFLLPITAGCWDRTELNNLAIITATAFDAGDDGQIRTTVQVIIPQNQSSSGESNSGGGANKRSTVRSEQGRNVAEALYMLQKKLPRKIFWGQCKIFIFSEDLAKKGIKETLDFLVRHPQPRESALIYVSKTKASEALELFPPIEHFSSDVLKKMKDMHIGNRVTLEQLNIMLKGESRTAALPIIRILPKAKSAEPFQTIPYMSGTALFQGDKMQAEWGEEMTAGLMWMRNETGEFTVSFEADGEGRRVALKPVKTRVRMVPDISGDRWSMAVKVQAEGTIVQNETLMNPMNGAFLARMEQAFQDEVRDRVLAMIQESQKQKLDIFDFGTRYYRHYPKQWRSVKAHWTDRYPEVQTTVDVRARIIRPGLANVPAGAPLDEVKQK